MEALPKVNCPHPGFSDTVVCILDYGYTLYIFLEIHELFLIEYIELALITWWRYMQSL
jgi:hypothetical protein